MTQSMQISAIGKIMPGHAGIGPGLPPEVLFGGEIPKVDIKGQTPTVGETGPLECKGMDEVCSRFGMVPDEVAAYLKPGEQLQGFGNGGSESLVMFVSSPEYGGLVRKICGEQLSCVDWDPSGTGVMSPPSAKAGHQVDYLLGLPEPVRPYFPSVYDVQKVAGEDKPCKLVYDQSFLEGTEVSTFIAEHRPTPEVVAQIHREILRCLADKVHPYRRVENAGSTIEPSYLDKIMARLELSQSTAPETFGPLLESDDIVINGQRHRNIGELLAFFGRPDVMELLEPKHHSLVVGDTNTENVMLTRPEALLQAIDEGSLEFTYDDMGIKFLDPRAIGCNSAGAETVDDRMYDNKPFHNSLGNYDLIHGEHFQIGMRQVGGIPHIDLKANPGNPFNRSYQGMEDYFSYIMSGWGVTDRGFLEDDPNWLLRFTFMMGSHFAAMPPFHFKKGPDGNVPEDPQSQKRAIAVYCEGIKWLNMAYEMIKGRKQELYGVPVPGNFVPCTDGANPRRLL